MADLRNTIAHILEHKQHLANVNEATIQQYVILPILRALGWNDTNLASMEVLPEYAVKGGQVDYALTVEHKLTLFIECKKWNESLDKHEDQIVTYAVKAGMPIVGLTNGKIWRFYFSWIEGTSVSDRIFCETDIENREGAVSDLEKYLLKSNVASGKGERNARIALKEKEKTASSEPVPRPIEPEATVRKSVADKFRESNDLESRKEIGCQVAKLRISPRGDKPMSWRRIRDRLGLKNDEFHKVIRLEDHFHESCVERIESFEGGWEYGGKLEVLLGFEPVGELLERIEACKPKTLHKE